MSDFRELIDWVQRLERRLADHEVATRNMLRVGPVVARDKDKGVRLQTDADPEGGQGEAHKSAWVNPAEPSGVARDVPRLGAQCMILAPYGDQEQGTLINFGHSDKAPNPASDVDETVLFNRGKIRISVSKDGKSLIFKNDKSTTTWDPDKTTIEQDGNKTVYEKDKITFPDGSKVRHGDRNIGKDHKHGDVQPGSGTTGDPEA